MRGNANHRWLFLATLPLGVLAFAQFALRPALQELSTKKSHLRATRAEIVRGENFTRGLDDLERYLSDFATALAELDRLVPSSGGADERLPEINDLVDDLDLSATKIQPNPPIRRGGITVHPLVIDLRGSFRAVEAFLFAVESFDRHSRVTACKLERASDDPSDATVVAELELTSFSVADEESGGAP